jgi:hypothetical protein
LVRSGVSRSRSHIWHPSRSQSIGNRSFTPPGDSKQLAAGKRPNSSSPNRRVDVCAGNSVAQGGAPRVYLRGRAAEPVWARPRRTLGQGRDEPWGGVGAAVVRNHLARRRSKCTTRRCAACTHARDDRAVPLEDSGSG